MLNEMLTESLISFKLEVTILELPHTNASTLPLQKHRIQRNLFVINTYSFDFVPIKAKNSKDIKFSLMCALMGGNNSRSISFIPVRQAVFLPSRPGIKSF